ncbi:hypothetical protein KC315_g7480, partial [Hortaea werneckii]
QPEGDQPKGKAEADTSAADDMGDVEEGFLALNISSKNIYNSFNVEFTKHEGSTQPPPKMQSKVSKGKISKNDIFFSSIAGTEDEALYPEYLPTDTQKKWSLKPWHTGEKVEDMYRGFDMPKFPIKYESKVDISTDRSAVVVIRNAKGEEVFSLGDLSGDKRKAITCKLVHYSQRPYVQLEIASQLGLKGQAEDKITWRAYGHAFVADQKKSTVGLDFAYRVGDYADQQLPDNPTVVQYSEKNQLWVTHMQLKAPGSPATQFDARPCFGGHISPGHAKKLASDLKAGAFLWKSEELVARLQDATHLSIYQSVPEKAWMDEFFQYMQTMTFATATLGTNWWYSLAASVVVGAKEPVPLTNPGFPFSDLPVLRMTAFSWVGNKIGRSLLDFEPSGWLCFPDMGSLPCDPVTYSFEVRFGVAREQHSANIRLESLGQWDEADVLATFYPDPSGNTDTFIVTMRVGGKASEGKPLPGPEVGRKISLDFYHKNRHVEMTGAVVDDPLHKGAPIAATVRPKKALIAPLTSEEEYRVSITWPFDDTASNRGLNAVSMLEQPQGRRIGVHFGEVCLNQPRPDGQQPDWLYRKLEARDLKERYAKELARHGLNEKQLQAGMDCAKPGGNGVNLIWGPPGTGKTSTLAATIWALLSTGAKVMVCATANLAVNNVMNAFKQMNKHEGFDDLVWCRYAGALQRISARPKGKKPPTAEGEAEPGIPSIGAIRGSWAEDAEDQDKEATLTAMFDRIAVEETRSFRNPEFADGMAAKKLRFIQSFAQRNPEKEFLSWGQQASLRERKESAERYLVLLDQLRGNKLKGPELKEAAKERRVLDEWFSSIYLQEKVQLVFVTNNSSCDDLLRTNFRPDVLAQDEAGQTSAADGIGPISGYKESIKMLLMCGDPDQLKPTVTSQSANEGFKALELSLFTRLMNQARTWDDAGVLNDRIRYVMLNIQYRMHPDISDWPRRETYPGLIDHESVRQTTDLDKRVQQMLSALSPILWNGRRRIAFDCSAGYSSFFAGGTSLYNKAEAKFAVGLALLLVKGAKVDPSDIVIMSPYNGMRRYIVGLLLAQDTAPEARQMSVMSIDNAQGSEAKIAIYCFTVNMPDDPTAKLKFAIQPERVNVGSTRAQRWMFLTGNFRGWIKCLKGKQTILSRKESSKFASLVQDLEARCDIMSSDDYMGVMAQERKVHQSSFYFSDNLATQAPKPKSRSGPGPYDPSDPSMASHGEIERGGDGSVPFMETKPTAGQVAPAPGPPPNKKQKTDDNEWTEVPGHWRGGGDGRGGGGRGQGGRGQGGRGQGGRGGGGRGQGGRGGGGRGQGGRGGVARGGGAPRGRGQGNGPRGRGSDVDGRAFRKFSYRGIDLEGTERERSARERSASSLTAASTWRENRKRAFRKFSYRGIDLERKQKQSVPQVLLPRHRLGGNRNRAFRKFSYNGSDLHELLDLFRGQLCDAVHARARRRLNGGLKNKSMGGLLDLSSEQLRDVVHGCARRRFNRGLKRKSTGLIKKLRKAEQEALSSQKSAVVKAHLRDTHAVGEVELVQYAKRALRKQGSMDVHWKPLSKRTLVPETTSACEHQVKEPCSTDVCSNDDKSKATYSFAEGLQAPGQGAMQYRCLQQR